jgi:hypothetical protein
MSIVALRQKSVNPLIKQCFFQAEQEHGQSAPVSGTLRSRFETIISILPFRFSPALLTAVQAAGLPVSRHSILRSFLNSGPEDSYATTFLTIIKEMEHAAGG